MRFVNSELSLRLQTNKFGCRFPTEQSESKIIRANPTACRSREIHQESRLKNTSSPAAEIPHTAFPSLCSQFAPYVTCVDSRVLAYA